MAGKITDLTALTSGYATGDLIEVLDISDTTLAPAGTNKKVTLGQLLAALPVPIGFAAATGTKTAPLVRLFSDGRGFYAAVGGVVFTDGTNAKLVMSASKIVSSSDQVVGFSSGTDVETFQSNDVGRSRKAAGVEEINNGTKGSYTGSAFGSGSQTVAQLPAAATAGKGARSFVTDASATTFLSTVAGGGANNVPVVSDGTNWLIG